MHGVEKTREDLEREIGELRAQLAEAQEMLRAIREGEVDALVVSTPEGQQIFTLQGADQTYRTIVEQMQEGAAALLEDGRISYSNRRFAEMVGRPLERIVGSHVCDYVVDSDQDSLSRLLRQALSGTVRGETTLRASDGRLVPVYVSLGVMVLDGLSSIGMVVTDLTERKRAAAAVQAERQRLFDVLETLPAMICLLTADYHIAFANRSFREKFGESHDRHCYEQCFGVAEPCGFCESYQVLKTGQPHHWEVNSPDGSVIAAYDFPFTDVDGSPMILEMDLDITEQRNAEAALRAAKETLEQRVAERTAELAESGERLRLALQAGGGGAWDFDAVTGEAWWSPEMYEMCGVPADTKMRLENILSMVHEQDRHLVQETVERCLATGEEYRCEYRIVHPSRGERWVAAYGRQVSDATGHRARMTGITFDITERKRAEEALRESHARLKKVLEVETVGVMFWDLTTGCLVDANDTFLKMMGYSRSDVEAHDLTWQKFTPPEYHEVSLAEIRKFQATGRVGPYEKEYFRKDGTRQWLVFAGSSLGGNSCVEFCVDIADRKKAEAALHESEALLRAITDNSPNPIFLKDRDCRMLLANPATLAVLGKPAGAVLGKTDEEFYDDPTAGRQMMANDRLVMEVGQTQVIEETVPAPEGPRTYLSTKSPYRDSEGRVIGVIGVALDLTERKQAEARLSADLAALTRMHALSGRLMDVGGLQPLLQEVMDAAVAIAGAERGTLQLLEGDSLRIAAHHGHQQPFLEFFAAAESRASACGQALQRGERVIVPDVETSSLFAETPSLPVLREAGVRAVQSTPMVSRAGKFLGILTTQWNVPHCPDEHDLWRIDLLARQAADFIENVKTEKARERTTALLEAIHSAQTRFIVSQEISGLFGDSLNDLLTLMNSQYGFIDELFYASDGKPYLSARGITDIAWNEESQEMYRQFLDGNLNFTKTPSLFGEVMMTGKPVIANDAPHDPRHMGIPPGHPPLQTFLGLPLHTSTKEFVGVVGLANRPGGYSEEDVAYLEPLMAAYANLIAAKRNDQRRHQAEQELRSSEENLKASLHEKEVLLKEIHHRVKNNMQVISSLVGLQADQLKDEAMRAVFQEVTHRVRSMALVHEKLYQSANMARVEFAEYAQSLLNYLWRAHGSIASGIRLVLDLEPVPLSVNAAVPCGLILNELATNAIKHAFRGCDGGDVKVSLRGGPEGQISLRVRDNGTGLPAGLDWKQAKSLGLRLVQILANQLDATVEVQSSGGTEFSVNFKGTAP